MKTFLKIFAGFVFVLILALSGVYMGRNTLIKHAVEKVGPKFTQTTVELGEVDFQPFQGYVMLKNLKIGNPKGFSEKDLFSLGKITIDLEPETLFGKKIIINRIAVKNVFANYEMANGTNNIEMLQRNILGKPKPEAKQQKSSSPSAAAKDKKKDAEKTFVITDLTVQDVKVSASVSGVRMTLPLPAIHMTDIGKKKPSTVKEIVSSLIKIFSKETLNAITTATTDALKSGADSIGKMIKNLF